MWFDLKLIAEMMDMCRTLFPVVNYASIYTPTYPSGQIGFLLCSTLPVSAASAFLCSAPCDGLSSALGLVHTAVTFSVTAPSRRKTAKET